MDGRVVVKRLVAAVRALPRHLREDLLTLATPPSPGGRPRWLDWRPALVLPLALCAVGVWVGLANHYTAGLGMSGRMGALLGGIQGAALVAALFRPVPAWWATVVTMVVVAPYEQAAALAVPWYGGPVGPGQGDPAAESYGFSLTLHTVVLLLLALRVRPRAALEALTISLLMGLLCGAFVFDGTQLDFRIAAMTLSAAVVLGVALRARQVARTQLVVQEELTADERARRTLLEERNRIARELHDVVAHHMSVISIQAQVAPHLAENPSPELRENLTSIRESALDALAELRRVLGVLRSEDALSQSMRHAPQPTLDGLGDLIAKVRGTGLTVTTEVSGEPRPLPPGVELSAYRIVQEALSNTMRHAPGAAAGVELGYRADGLTVRITNTAPPERGEASGRVPSPREGEEQGHGVLGMRERAAMLGGELAAGPTPDGGYEVTAALPVASRKASARPVEDIR